MKDYQIHVSNEKKSNSNISEKEFIKQQVQPVFIKNNEINDKE